MIGSGGLVVMGSNTFKGRVLLAAYGYCKDENKIDLFLARSEEFRQDWLQNFMV
jgi:hypothetical protein